MIKYCYFLQPLNVITLRYASLDVSIMKLYTVTKFNIAFKPVSLPFHTRRLCQHQKKVRESNTKPVQRPFDLTARRNIKLLENKQLRYCILAAVLIFFLFPCDLVVIFVTEFLVPLGFFSYVSCFCTFSF